MNEDHKPQFFAENIIQASTSKSTGKKESLTKKQQKQQQQQQRQLIRPPPMPVLKVDTEENVKKLDISAFQLQNGHMETNSSIGLTNKMKNNETSEAAETNHLSLCNMCNRSDDVCVNVQNNHGIVLMVSEMTRLPVS